MSLTIIQFVLSAATTILAGIFLTRYADLIAQHTKLGRILVGSLFLAGATSLPEFFVDLSAVRNQMPNLAVGDLMGSSLFNILILAIADLLHKGTGKIFTRASAAQALSASMSISVTAIAGLAIFLGPQLSHFSIGAFGLGSLAIVAAYALGLRLIFYDQRPITAENTTLPTAPTTSDTKKITLARAFAGYFISVLVLLIAAPFMAQAAGQIADQTGLGKTFIGTTLVAFCTSLPELVATLTAVRLGAYDMAIGNIFGSNAFNMVLLAPLDLVYNGPLLASVSRIHVITALTVILTTSVAVMGQLYQVERRKKFIEPDAFLIIALVISSFILLYFIKEV